MPLCPYTRWEGTRAREPDLSQSSPLTGQEWAQTKNHEIPSEHKKVCADSESAQTWWNESHDWSTGVEGYRLFGRDRQGRRGGGVTLNARERFVCTALTVSSDVVESLWVRTRGMEKKGDVVVGVYYRLPSQNISTAELFYRQLGEISGSIALVLMGDFNCPDINWEYPSAGKSRSWKFLVCAEAAALPSVLQQGLVCTAAAALLLLPDICWLAREMKLASDSCSEQDSSSSEEEDDEEEEDLNGADNGARSLAVSTPSPMQGLPDTCKVLKELVGDLLGVCRVLCKSTFMPQMHPAIGMDGTYEAWSVGENSIAYSLLVLLRPPPGHSFSLELDTTGQLPARHSSIQVVLECTCSREQLLGESWCFLHHPDDKLPRDQSSCLLRTLCTCSYLDMEKVASWVQLLVRSAWLLLPQSQHCQLMVLPSSQSCRFQLTSTRLKIF
ncbi:hypothetical protein QYF61_010760 [Mycteria americana]|uniref:Endonuclease/exonuclease/phosphatase domain-containing protein n=1 Tax=Mycteria americana TaxID=33587 RepID=A0AAN7S4R1_MYCAM|nr:hypothetical protein QYF61_010760 [Mycteria americana]